MGFWDPEHLDPEDEVNRDIWAMSASVQARVLDDHQASNTGLLQAEFDLPGVPDLAGRRWREPGSVVVIGSAYSPFIDGHAGRGKTMRLADYNPKVDVVEFQRRFVRDVVAGDPNYYDPLAHLLGPAVGDASHVVLLDLCRACLLDKRNGNGGDEAVDADPDLFMDIAEANWPWTRRRLFESRAEVVVVLGYVAEHALLRLLHADGFTITAHGRRTRFEPSNRAITKYATTMHLGDWLDRETWWEVEHRESVRRWKLLPVYHPTRFNQWDPGYKRSRRLLARVVGLPMPGLEDEEGQVYDVHPSERRPSATGVDRASWSWVLDASVPPVGRLLTEHPDAQARTARLAATLDLARLVVLADVLYNRCRMSYLNDAGSDSDARRSETAWRWLEAGIKKRHAKASGWTGAARLLRDGADEAIVVVRDLDIGELAGVALRVVDGPYREANKRGIK